jgi:SAM-dependent methyltransferase
MQYGCGWSAPTGWLNFDASPTLIFERLPLVGKLYTRNDRRFPDNVRYGDIVRGLPLAPGSCDGIYCSHVLEHLALDDFHTALENTKRYLKAGGYFRFVLPDLEQLARNYLSDASPSAASSFMEASCLGRRSRSRGIKGLAVYLMGNSSHLWMWDEKSLAEQLTAHGFKSIRRASFGDADDSRFNEVEDPGRFEGCLALQCQA